MAFTFAGTHRFEIIRKLGEGGMGVVYEAFDRERSAGVAIKTLRNWSADLLLRFKGEFRGFRHFCHPNLVSLGELYEHEGQWFMTMELIDGEDWLTYVGRGTSMDEGRLRSSLDQVMQGLRALHQVGRVHRDVKPTNILVTPGGRAVLLDYGLATDITRNAYSASSTVVGTPAYMAPEQFEGKRSGPEADWYSVGVMLYEAMIGTAPFQGNVLTIGANKRDATYTRPETIRTDLPLDLCNLCSQLLEPNPEKRIQSRFSLLGFEHTSDHSPPPRSTGQPTDPSFVGRKKELERLHEALSAVCHSRNGMAIILHGESGIGKSSTLAQFEYELRKQSPDVVILASRCYEHESIPFNAMDGVVDALSRYLARLAPADISNLLPTNTAALVQTFPILGRIEAVGKKALDAAHRTPQETRAQTLDALRGLFDALGTSVPLLIMVDDLQWADEDSASCLRELFRAGHTSPFLFVGTSRSQEDCIRLQISDVQLFRLDPFDLSESKAFTAQFFEKAAFPVDEDLETLVHRASGNPFLLGEATRYALSQTHVDNLSTETILDTTLSTTLGRLDRPLKRVMEAVALSSAPVEISIATRVASLTGREGLEAIKKLEESRLLRSATRSAYPSHLELYHDSIRHPVLGSIVPSDKATLHRQIALLLETSPVDDPESLATHWREAGEPAKAARYLELAGEKAEKAFAFENAVAFYKSCLEHIDLASFDSPDANRKQYLLVKLGHALGNAGRSREAADTYRLALVSTEGPLAKALRRWTADQLLRSGHVDEGLAEIETILRKSGLFVPKSLWGKVVLTLIFRAALWFRRRNLNTKSQKTNTDELIDRMKTCWLAAVELSLLDPIRGLYFHTRHLLMSIHINNESHIMNGLAVEATFVAAVYPKRIDAILSILNSCKRLSNESLSSYDLAFGESNRGIVSFMQGAWVDAHHRFEIAETIFQNECTGVTWEVSGTRIFRLNTLFQLGEYRALAATVPSLVREAERCGDLFTSSSLRTLHTNVAWLCLDDPNTARSEADKAMIGWSQRTYNILNFSHLLARVNISIYEGRYTAAKDELLEGWPVLTRSKLMRISSVRIRALCQKLCVTLAVLRADGASPRDVDDAKRLIRRLQREDSAWAYPFASYGQAVLALVENRIEAAIRALKTAEERFGYLDMKGYELACRRAVVLIQGDDDAAPWAREAIQYIADQKVANPVKFLRFLLPELAAQD